MTKKFTYLAVLEKGQSGYGVYFPDLPGCISGGESLEEALESAQEALSLHLWGFLDDEEMFPAPQTATTIHLDGNETIYPVMVSLEI